MNFGLFGLIGLIGLGILSLLMWLLTGGLGLNYVLSKIVATAFVYAWNFLARRAMYHDEPVAVDAETEG
jgi:putative flippase GtrA